MYRRQRCDLQFDWKMKRATPILPCLTQMCVSNAACVAYAHAKSLLDQQACLKTQKSILALNANESSLVISNVKR